MRIRRTIPPTAAPVKLIDLVHGLIGLFYRRKHLKKLEAEIRECFGVTHVFCVSSGKAALTLILLALKDLSEKRQVIIPAYTCFSVPSAIVKAGLEIVLCDIDPTTFDFDYGGLERAVTNETLCVLATHLFGIPADLERIGKLCQERGVFVVEDAAQAMGGQYKGRMLGTVGDVGFYSLGRGKNITCGSGGIIVTDSNTIAAVLTRQYANLEEPPFEKDVKEFFQTSLMIIFIHPSFYWFPAEMSFLKLGQTFFYKDFPMYRLSSRRAALLQNWQERLTESKRTRVETAACFFKEIRVKNTQTICLPYLRFPLLVNDRQTRDLLYSLSQKNALGLSVMYPTAVNEIEEIKTTFYGKTFPMAKRVAETLVTLPTHHLLSEKDKRAICELLNSTVPPEVLQVATPSFGTI